MSKLFKKIETFHTQENAGIPDYLVDKKSGVAVHCIENKENASGFPAPEYVPPVCGENNKKAEILQETVVPVKKTVSPGLKSTSSGKSKHSLLVAGEPEQKPVA